MATWRYTAVFAHAQTDEAGTETPLEVKRPYNYSLESEEQGLEGLEEFLNSRKEEFEERLWWVALERSETDAVWNHPYREDFEEVKRLLA